MGRALINLIGNKYGKLTVVKKSEEKSKNGSPKWICQCDCGNTTIVERSNLIKGNVKSCGKCHITNTYDLSNEYGIGYLSNGEKFLFDKDDYELIKKYNWSKTGSNYLINTKGNKTISMHRLIINAPDDMIVDHINHNTLDNRKENLRLCNHSQNNINKKIKGFTLRNNGKYEVSIRLNGKPTYIGRFNSEIEAIEARKMNYDEDHKNFEYRKELVNVD